MCNNNNNMANKSAGRAFRLAGRRYALPCTRAFLASGVNKCECYINARARKTVKKFPTPTAIIIIISTNSINYSLI